jgi:ubiquinone/menaquinone biosynthesis C-methylase UbiE
MKLADYLDPHRQPIETVAGIPSFVAEIAGKEEAQWNRAYDFLAPFYEYTERFFGRLIVGVDVRAEWQNVAKAPGFSRNQAILEVAPGPGVYQPYLLNEIGPAGTLVSLDLSMGMLRACQRRMANREHKPLLVHGTGSDLPFRDAAFDGLFHVGGINLFAEPEKAISEFARVVKKDGIVAIGDEGFSPDFPDGLRKKILSKMNPGYLKSKLPVLPESLRQKSLGWHCGGCLYLIVAVKE